jgi:hypothetical protein
MLFAFAPSRFLSLAPLRETATVLAKTQRRENRKAQRADTLNMDKLGKGIPL